MTTADWPVAAANGAWIAERVVHAISPSSGFTTEIVAVAEAVANTRPGAEPPTIVEPAPGGWPPAGR